MRLKWIRCQVPGARRAAFSRAQAEWSAIEGAEGLLGQAGGFDAASPGTACVAALWRTDEDYRRFMATLHDEIASASRQASAYDAIDVLLFDERFPMPGEAGGLAEGLAGARLLRVAECTVLPARAAHFEEVQARIWRPAMAGAAGMLGGSFLRAPGGRYLVLTAWHSAADHDAYTAGVAALRDRAGAAADLASIVGRRVALEPTWSVGLPPAPPGG